MAELQLDLDDMVLLASGLPREVREQCLDAYEQGKKAIEDGEMRLAEVMKSYIRQFLVLHKIIEDDSTRAN